MLSDRNALRHWSEQCAGSCFSIHIPQHDPFILWTHTMVSVLNKLYSIAKPNIFSRLVLCADLFLNPYRCSGKCIFLDKWQDSKRLLYYICFYFLLNSCLIFRWPVLCKTYAFKGVCDHVRPVSANLWKTHGRTPVYSCTDGRNVLGCSNFLCFG